MVGAHACARTYARGSESLNRSGASALRVEAPELGEPNRGTLEYGKAERGDNSYGYTRTYFLFFRLLELIKSMKR